MKRSRSLQPASRPCCSCECDNPRRTSRPSKSNLTAERVTLLPGFLSKRSKSSDSPSSSPDDDGSVKPQVRRSWRLCKKNQPVTISGYFNKLVESKSIFKEIKDKFREEEEEVDDGFGRNLFRRLIDFVPTDTLCYKNEIRKEIEGINSILLGKSTRNMSINRKRPYSEEDKENYPMKFPPHIPPSNWVFQTPPNRKLNYNHVKVDDNGIKPAVLETRNEKKVVYEMNNKISVDLSGFSNRQEIDIDKRYMMESTLRVQEDEDLPDDKMDFLQSDSLELENHFLGLTCRPKKVATAINRFNTLKRKRDIFEPQPGCSTAPDEYKPTVCFLDTLNLNNVEESFTFKFSSDSVEGSTTGHLFDFEGNKKNTFNFRF